MHWQFSMAGRASGVDDCRCFGDALVYLALIRVRVSAQQNSKATPPPISCGSAGALLGDQWQPGAFGLHRQYL